jgi:hypothetical protein
MRRRVDHNGRAGVSAVARTGLLFIALIGGNAPAHADGAWCGAMSGPDGGYVTCAYATREQCIVAASGVGGVCFENPANAARLRSAPWIMRPSLR